MPGSGEGLRQSKENGTPGGKTAVPETTFGPPRPQHADHQPLTSSEFGAEVPLTVLSFGFVPVRAGFVTLQILNLSAAVASLSSFTVGGAVHHASQQHKRAETLNL